MKPYAILCAHIGNYRGDDRTVARYRGYRVFDYQGAGAQPFFVTGAFDGNAGGIDFQRSDRNYVASGVFLGFQETIEERTDTCY